MADIVPPVHHFLVIDLPDVFNNKFQLSIEAVLNRAEDHR